MDPGSQAATQRARTLRLHCLRLDVVEAAGRGSSTLLSGILFALLAAAIVAGIAERQPPLLFALLGLFALVDAFGDVATALLDARDLPLLRTLAIAPGEYVRARLVALALPVVVKTLALGVPVMAALVAHGAGLRAAAAFFAAFAAMSATLSALAVLALLLLRQVWPGIALHVGLAWARSLLLVAATAGWLLLLRGPPDAADATGESPLFDAPILPSAWFAELASLLAGAPEPRLGRIAAAFALSAAAAIGFAALATNYVRLLEGLSASASARRRGSPIWRRWFERTFVAADERPTFRLGLALLRRERTFRLQTLPLLAYPLLFLGMGARGEGEDDGGLFAVLFAQLPALVLALACIFLRFSDSPAGGFVLRFFARGTARPLETGGRKALWYAVALPLALVVTGLLAWDRGILFGATVGAVGLLSSTLAVLKAVPPVAELPFVHRFEGRIEGGEGGRVFALFFAAILAAALEWRVVRSGPVAMAGLAIAALVASAWLLRRPAPPSAAPAPDAGDVEIVEEVAQASVPFPVRLRRELQGLAVFFALAGLALTAFFAWI